MLWSWDSVHLSEEIHQDRRLFDGFLKWLKVQVAGLPTQALLPKKQLHEVLLGLGLILRDHQFACFTNYEETSVPQFLVESCMEAADDDMIDSILNKFVKVIEGLSE